MRFFQEVKLLAFEKSKGMVAVETSSGYEKLDPYIEAGSLNITPDAVQEADSYRNANGALKRPNIMPLTISKIEFNIKHTDEKTMDKVMSILKRGTQLPGGIAAENKIHIRFYNPKRMEYSFAWTYFPEITYNVYGTYMGNGNAIYTPTRIALISYGEKAS